MVAILDLNGSNVTLPDGPFFGGQSHLNGNDDVTNNGGADATLTTGGGPSNTIYSGTTSNGTHKVAITQTGAFGDFVEFAGNNTYSGGTHLEGGTLAVGSASALGTGALTMEINTTLLNQTIGGTLSNSIVL